MTDQSIDKITNTIKELKTLHFLIKKKTEEETCSKPLLDLTHVENCH